MGDIRLAQSMLSQVAHSPPSLCVTPDLCLQVASQHYQESCTRSGKIIKPAAQLLRGESRYMCYETCSTDCNT